MSTIGSVLSADLESLSDEAPVSYAARIAVLLRRLADDSKPTAVVVFRDLSWIELSQFSTIPRALFEAYATRRLSAEDPDTADTILSATTVQAHHLDLATWLDANAEVAPDDSVSQQGRHTLSPATFEPRLTQRTLSSFIAIPRPADTAQNPAVSLHSSDATSHSAGNPRLVDTAQSHPAIQRPPGPAPTSAVTLSSAATTSPSTTSRARKRSFSASSASSASSLPSPRKRLLGTSTPPG